MNKERENKILDSFEMFLESEEGKKLMEEFAKKEAFNKSLEDKYIEKFHSFSKEKRFEIIKKIVDKYSSDEYAMKEYKLGYEPRTPLYFMYLSYAERYGKDLYLEYREYLPFCESLVEVDGTYVELLIGQGSVVNVMLSKDEFLSEVERCKRIREKYEEK